MCILIERRSKDHLGHRKVAMPQVVFATAFNQYAVRAFEVNAIDYLLKPFDRKRVMQTIEKAQARLAAPIESAGLNQETGAKLDALLRLVEEQAQPPKANSGKVVVRAQNRLLLVDQREICFASIEEGTISVVTRTLEGHSNCRTLEELMDQLEPEMFWRAHRSYLVNIQHIREVVPWFKSSYQLRMDDTQKTEIPVSRAQTKRLRELFNLYGTPLLPVRKYPAFKGLRSIIACKIFITKGLRPN
jgi:DNA-binding LytR/AlgR family response regulator